MTYFKTFTLLVLTIFLATSIQAQTYIGKDKDIQIILKNIKTFSQYYMDGEIKKLTACYTTDGKIFPGKTDIIEGHEAIEKRWTLPEGVEILLHKVTPSEIRIVKNYAYDYGYYEGETRNANGEKFTFKGKYVIVWRKVGKDWKIYLDMWNSLD